MPDAYLVAFSEHFVSVVQLVRVDLAGEAQQGDVHGGHVASWHLTLLLSHLGGGPTQLAEGVCLTVQLQHRRICACITAAEACVMLPSVQYTDAYNSLQSHILCCTYYVSCFTT